MMTYYLFNKCISIATYCIFHQQKNLVSSDCKNTLAAQEVLWASVISIWFASGVRKSQRQSRVDPCKFPPTLSVVSHVFSGWEQSSRVWVKREVLDVKPSHLVLISPSPVCLPLCCHLIKDWLQLQPCGAHESWRRTNTHLISSHECLNSPSGGKIHLNTECCTVNVLDFKWQLY